MLEFFKLIHGWSIASWKFNLITGCLKPDPLGGQSAWCFSWGPWSRRDTIPHQVPSMENWCMKAADTPALHKQGVSKIALVDGTSAVSLNNASILAVGGFRGWHSLPPIVESGASLAAVPGLLTVTSLSAELGIQGTVAQQSWGTSLAVLWHVGSSQTRDGTHGPCTGKRMLNHWTTREVLLLL